MRFLHASTPLTRWCPDAAYILFTSSPAFPRSLTAVWTCTIPSHHTSDCSHSISREPVSPICHTVVGLTYQRRACFAVLPYSLRCCHLFSGPLA
ncbi:uncharacterized protein LAESUDRAFT_682634 [Laetiporus sulphureus 93-53]|uniref:Uncharacterized protein n=1 Tax=Laetiporus sulphureus 93-53 TaxID=1314785 RepID=A0A165DB14_9APHY|nr:uncharacterized protein LAESUDRAFT_682634 [Laetiporus sulphureus 93-53]KZT04463.1 hypothetical protein LAESUDRAFT_682634 [Laetiporus sulphureus 93-53]